MAIASFDGEPFASATPLETYQRFDLRQSAGLVARAQQLFDRVATQGLISTQQDFMAKGEAGTDVGYGLESHGQTRKTFPDHLPIVPRPGLNIHSGDIRHRDITTQQLADTKT
jgi:hypothetical protein